MSDGCYVVANRELLPVIEDSIRSGVPVRLTVRGGSMRPLLRDGKDTVSLHPCFPAMLRKGDVVFFRYGDGFILHRIIHIGEPPEGADLEEAVMVTRGDAMKQTETVTLGDVIAVAELPRLSLFRKAVRCVRYSCGLIYHRQYPRFCRGWL